MNNPFQGRRLFGAGLALLVFAPGAGLAAPIVSSQSLDFSTTGQSLWAPGTDALAGLGFSRTFIDQTVAPTTIGVITGTVQVPNPARPVYDAAASACNALGDVLGPPCVDALGPRPPANITLSQKNGAALTYSGELKFGLSGGLQFDAGKVDAGFSTKAAISVDDAQAAPGQAVTIHTTQSDSSTSLASQFSGLDANLTAHLGIKTKADVTAFVADVGGTLPVSNIDKSSSQDLVTVGVQGPTATVNFPILGTPPATVPFGVNQDVGIGIADLIDVPFLSHNVHLPQLDSSNTVAGIGVTNDIEPIDRTCAAFGSCPVNPTDYEKLSINLATLSLLADIPLGISAGIPHVIEIEEDILKGDFSLIGEFSQQLTFDPNLMVTLNFDRITEVEVAPGVFAFVNTITVPVGQDVTILQPDGDLSIDPVYSLSQNSFSNDTEWLLQLLQSFNFLEFAISGPAANLSGLATDVSALATQIPLGGPIDLGPLNDGTPFSLLGFEDVTGDPIRLAALIGPEGGGQVPEPPTILTLLASLLGAVWWRRPGRALSRSLGVGPTGSQARSAPPLEPGAWRMRPLCVA